MRLPDQIAQTQETAASLAQRLPVDRLALQRLLRALVAYGLLTEDAAGVLALTPAGALLQETHPSLLHAYALLVGEQHYPAWGQLLHTIQTGQTGFEQVFGQSFFAYLAEHPEVGHRFDRLMSWGTSAMVDALRAVYDFSTCSTVVDIGGGQGLLLIRLLKAYPQLRGILYDRPPLVPAARTSIEAAGLAQRCQVMAGDFFTSLPKGGDAYLLSQVLHDWTDEQAHQILHHCYQAIPAEGVLLIWELVMPDSIEPQAAPRSQSERAVRQDLSMLVLMGGRERTEKEFRQLLAAAGFTLEHSLPTQAPRTLLVARPRGK